MLEIQPATGVVVGNFDDAVPVPIGRGQQDVNSGNVFIPRILHHLTDDENFVPCTVYLTHVRNIHFKYVVHGVLPSYSGDRSPPKLSALFARPHGRAMDAVRRGHPCFTYVAVLYLHSLTVIEIWRVCSTSALGLATPVLFSCVSINPLHSKDSPCRCDDVADFHDSIDGILFCCVPAVRSSVLKDTVVIEPVVLVDEFPNIMVCGNSLTCSFVDDAEARVAAIALVLDVVSVCQLVIECHKSCVSSVDLQYRLTLPEILQAFFCPHAHQVSLAVFVPSPIVRRVLVNGLGWLGRLTEYFLHCDIACWRVVRVVRVHRLFLHR